MQGELIKKQPTPHLTVKVLFKKRKSPVLFLTDTRADIFFNQKEIHSKPERQAAPQSRVLLKACIWTPALGELLQWAS